MRRIFAHLRAPGRAAALAALVLMLLLRGLQVAPVAELQRRLHDIAQVLAPRPPDPVHVYVVAIDDDALRRFGQWPWPRSRIARLVDRIAAGKPRVLGLDILFSEPDRLSPPLLARLPELPADVATALAQLPASDKLLADAVAKIPTVLAVAPAARAASAAGALRTAPLLQAGADPRRFLPTYPFVLRNVPEIAAVAAGAGVIAADPDADGVIRRVPLAVVAAGQLLPALSLEMLRLAAGVPAVTIVAGPGGIDRVELGPLSLPTDARGAAILHFAPPQPRFLSAADLLDGRVAPAALRGALVLLGVTGLGTVDVRQTPLGPMQGIEIHAQLLESMLFNQLLRRAPGGVGSALLLALIAGLLPILVLPYDAPFLAAGALAALVTALLAGEFAAFRFPGVLIDGGFAALTAVITCAAMVGGNLRAAQIARRRLAAELQREREVRARIDGELAAARSIQMGLLPRRFPIFPGRGDLDLYAHIEPARSVGGDLYDFMLIDRDRLFFMIADVSGKGVPAALFMAMTKEVIRDAVLRHGAALDLVLAAANTRTGAASADLAREGSDMMFVTAFAGVLDLATGDLAFASAGHDSPFVLAPGAPPRQLRTEGGPPLGAVDDFVYPVDYDRLEPRDVLVLYTDGVTEAENADHVFYTGARLAKALAALPVTSAEAVLDAALADLRGFVGDAEPADDITIITLRRLALSAP